MNMKTGTSNEIVHEVMKDEGINQVKLTKLMGKEWQGGVSTSINSKRMSVGKLCEMMNAMGYSVFVCKENNISEESVYKITQ